MSEFQADAGDQIRITRAETGWVAAIHGKGGSVVGKIPTSQSAFPTPELALADLLKGLA